jgi:alkanesulfonate monooxygenase SsuD/methylene tetrahydromethanopterin reductase-like flavin-dependent oxidoreductase (luciferase family)
MALAVAAYPPFMTVRFAVGLPNVGEYGDPVLLRDLAVIADRSGWDAVYVWDHVLAKPPQWPVANPVVTAAAIASATTRVRLIMACALPRRRVQVVAKETVALDQISGGRLSIVALLGSNDLEYSGFGEPPDLRGRGARLDAALDDLVALWSGEPVVVSTGTEAVHLLPRPVQRPRIPIWCAGRWPNRPPFRRAARFDGAMPTFIDQRSRVVPGAELADVVEYVAAHRGGSMAGFDIVTEGMTTTPSDVDLVRSYVDAGLTWWIEEVTWQGSVAAARTRIAAGPPAL